MNDELGEVDRTALLRANEDAAAFFRDSLLSEAGAGPQRYLVERGFGTLMHDTAWTVGHAPPGWRSTRNHLLALGHTDEVLLEAGLISRTRNGRVIDRFRDRLTFGVRAADGELVGFSARSAPGARGDVPKYLNTPRTRLYDKSVVLLGLGEQAARLHSGATPVLVEGALDAIAVDIYMTSSDRQLAPLSPCGTGFTCQQAKLIDSLSNAGSITVAFDRDPAGSRAAKGAYAHLRSYFPSVLTADLPRGTDPADLLRCLAPNELRPGLMSGPPLADRLVDDLITAFPNPDRNAEVRVACLRAIARLVVTMSPLDITRQARRIPGILDLSQATATRELVAAASPHPEVSSAGVSQSLRR